MLETNDFVALYALDFSKAFDSIRHKTLIEKLAELAIPDFIHNWIVDFLSGRAHSTRHNGVTSASATINASVIQGSAIGPVVYIVNAADLKPLSDSNKMFKYADDTYLLVPAKSIDTAAQELANIEEWAMKNNLRLNKAKSAEVIFTDPNRKSRDKTTQPPPQPGIPRVDEIKILGVTISNRLSVNKHVHQTISACSQTLFALKTLRAHGLKDSSLQTIYKSVAVAKLQYAACAWRRFAAVQDIQRIESFLKKSIRARFYPKHASNF